MRYIRIPVTFCISFNRVLRRIIVFCPLVLQIYRIIRWKGDKARLTFFFLFFVTGEIFDKIVRPPEGEGQGDVRFIPTKTPAVVFSVREGTGKSGTHPRLQCATLGLARTHWARLWHV